MDTEQVAQEKRAFYRQVITLAIGALIGLVPSTLTMVYQSNNQLHQLILERRIAALNDLRTDLLQTTRVVLGVKQKALLAARDAGDLRKLIDELTKAPSRSSALIPQIEAIGKENVAPTTTDVPVEFMNGILMRYALVQALFGDKPKETDFDSMFDVYLKNLENPVISPNVVKPAVNVSFKDLLRAFNDSQKSLEQVAKTANATISPFNSILKTVYRGLAYYSARLDE